MNERIYRYKHKSSAGWTSFEIRYRETDLWIRARQNLEKEALATVLNCRLQLEEYIAQHPAFLRSLSPLPDDPLAPRLVRQMLKAAQTVGVGPMAAVAGAIAESVALELKSLSPSIIIENGGDCYIDIEEEIRVGIYAGNHSPFSGQIAVCLAPDRFPLGICTSSGTVGHSLSFGKADAVTVLCKETALADAAATAIGNLVQDPGDIARALEWSSLIPALEGVLILIQDRMGARGDIELVPP